jgi:tetratricopeptide (TPR) repeat protein
MGRAADPTKSLPGRSQPELGDAPTEGGPAREPREPTPPERLGRYVVLDRLGAGGMGVVYAAYDPELDRKVAIKVVKHVSAEAGARLQREAQAMARLVHRNVVVVFDAGSVDDEVFVAMELVEGVTLRRWLAARAARWREIVAMFGQTGDGLAAAHAAGIVHRDFKPENVLVGADGVPRVADFGLARTQTDEGDAAGTTTPGGGTLVTHAGARLGTPAYMAPEQQRGAAVTPAADQYAFCVSLYEALYGARPSDDQDRGPRAAVPARIRRVVLRGLAERPEERWPSMAALLAALRHDPARRWRWAALGAVTLGLGATAVVAAGRAGAPGPPPCANVAAAATQVWDGAARARVERALAPAPARTALASLEAALDGWTARWQRARTEACVATREARAYSGDVLDRRTACLERELADVRALVEVAAEPSPTLFDRVPELTARLPDLGRCEANAVLGAHIPPPGPDAAARVGQVRDGLSRVRALTAAGRYEEALPRAEELVQASRSASYPPVEGEALVVLGRAEDDRGRLEPAVAALDEAQRTAAAVGDGPTELAALLELAGIVGEQQEKTGAALAITRDAEMLAARLEDESALAELARRRGLLTMAQDAPAAEKLLQRALAEEKRLHGAESVQVDEVLDALARVSVWTEDYAASLRYSREALALGERILGPDHPRLGRRLEAVAGLLREEFHDYTGALPLFERELRLEEAYGPDSLDATRTRGHIALCLARLDRHAEALALARRALADAERLAGPETVAASWPHAVLALILDDDERWDEALPHMQVRLRIHRDRQGADSPTAHYVFLWLAAASARAGRPLDLADVRRAYESMTRSERADGDMIAFAESCMCQALVTAEQWPEATDHCARAQQQADRAMASLDVGAAFWLNGAALIGAGRPADARAALERSLAVLEGRAGGKTIVARVRFQLARATLAASGDRDGALALARAARANLAQVLGADAPAVARIERWIASAARSR